MKMFELVPMSAEHIPQIAEIEKQCFSTPWSISQITDELNNPLSACFAAMDGDTVAGYIGSQTVLGEACVMNVAVRPDYRRQGVGSLLMECLIDHCLSKNDVLLTLEVRESNEPALALYEAFGFKKVGRRRGYYLAPKEDALIMTKYFSEESGQ